MNGGDVSDLALVEDTTNLRPSAGATLKVDTVLRKARTEGCRSFPRVVVRNLRADMVKNVGLGDAVRRRRADPGSNGSKVTEERAVECRERATRECVRLRAVVRQNGVRVLEERDEDQPVVDPVTI
jgi:hypothetical protein